MATVAMVRTVRQILAKLRAARRIAWLRAFWGQGSEEAGTDHQYLDGGSEMMPEAVAQLGSGCSGLANSTGSGASCWNTHLARETHRQGRLTLQAMPSPTKM